MSWKKCLVIAFAAIAGFAIGVFSPVVAKAQEKVVKLKFANYLPPMTAHTKICEEFIKDLEERTGGRIKVTYYKGGTLLKGPGMYHGVKTGITDIGFAHVYYTPERMPVTEMIGLPLGSPSAWVSSHALNDFYFKFRPKEWNDVEVLWLSGTMSASIISKKPINSLEDVKGKVIRAPGIAGDIVRALGGSAAPTPIMEVYDGLAKGVLDGDWGNFEIIQAFRLSDVAKYTTTSWEIGSTYPFYTIMNKRAYKKIPPDLKRTFDDLCGEYRERFALMWNQIEITGRNHGLKTGMTFIDLKADEAKKWSDAVNTVIEANVKRMVSKGFSEDEVRGWIAFLKERIEYYTKKQIEYRIPAPTGPEAMRPENIGK